MMTRRSITLLITLYKNNTGKYSTLRDFRIILRLLFFFNGHREDTVLLAQARNPNTHSSWPAPYPHILNAPGLQSVSLPDKLMSRRRSGGKLRGGCPKRPPATQARPRSRHQARQGGDQKWHTPEKQYSGECLGRW